MNLIYVYESDQKNGIVGKLSQGNFKDATSLIEGPQEGVTHLILAASDFQEHDKVFTCLVTRAPLNDADDLTPEEYLAHKTLALETAKKAASLIKSGHHVLSTCWAGLNRSGLISGLTLIQLGFSADDSVEIVRKGVCKYALCNDMFVQMIEEVYAEQNNNTSP